MMSNLSREHSCAAVVCLAVLAGCTHTEMASQVNPDYAGHAFTKVIVEADIADLIYRKKTEANMCQEINSHTNTTCVVSTDVFFPGESYTPEQIQSRIAQQRADGFMVIKAYSGVSSVYIPPTTYVTGNARITGNTIDASAAAQTVGGDYVEKPWANYQVDLWRIADNKVAWYATGESKGSAFASWDDMVDAITDKIIDQLRDDGVMHK